MRRLLLFLIVLLTIWPIASAQSVTQTFTGNIGGENVTGTLTIQTNFTFLGQYLVCGNIFVLYGNVYQGTATMTVTGSDFTVTTSGTFQDATCGNDQDVNFTNSTNYFRIGCFPYSYGDGSEGIPQLPFVVYPNCYALFSVPVPGQGSQYGYVNGLNSPQQKQLGNQCDCTSPPQVVGEPITLSNGNMFESVTDYTTAGTNKLSFIRYYNSQADPSSLATDFGLRWRSNFDRVIRIVSSSYVLAERPDGQELGFTLQNGVWTPDSDIDVTLTKAGSTWVLTDKNDTVETYTTLTLENDLQITYTEAQLKTIQRRNGYTQTLAYTSNQLTAVTDSNGRSLSFTYTGPLIQTVTTPDGLVLTYGFTSSGITPGVLDRLSSVTYSTTPQTSQTYLYENSALPLLLTGVVDENKNRYLTWGYDSSGRAISSSQGSGADAADTADQTTISYDDTTGNRTVTNALGQSLVYKFTTLQGVPKLTEIDRQATPTTLAATRTFSYDSNGYVASQTDWNGNKTVFTNDVHGQPTTTVEASGTTVARTTSIVYDPTWFHLPAQVTAPGVTTTFMYDASGNPLKRTQTDTTTTNGQARTWNFTWGSPGLLATAKGPRTDVDTTKQFFYDSSGSLTKITDALKHSVQITNTPGGRPQTIVDQNMVSTRLDYDARQRLTKQIVTTSAGALTTSFGFDAAGNLISTTLPDNSTLTDNYDTAHRLTQVTDSLGNYVSYTLDGLGDRMCVDVYAKDAKSPIWQRSATFDALGRLHVNTAGAGQTTTQMYDANGNVLSVADGLSQTTTNMYDALNRLSMSTDANGAVTTPGYDAQDHVISVQDANGNTTSYVRDGFGEVTQQTSPDSGTTTFVYDADGNQTKKTDALSIVTSQTFDALDRPLTTTYPASPAENVSYTYDETSTGFSFDVGRLSSVIDQAGSVKRTYDERGNLTSETRVNGGKTLVTGYGYDAASRIASITHPDGTYVAKQYDAAGYLANITATLPGATAPTQIATFTHEPFGPIGTVTYGNGVTEAWTFDQSYRATNITDALSGTNLQNLTYKYDLADNVKSIADAMNAANSQTFDYDPINRLKDATSGPSGYGSLAWTYDLVGNRLTQTQGSVTTQYGYTQGTNRLLTISTASTSQAVLRRQHPARKPSQTVTTAASIHAPPGTKMPVRATGPPPVDQAPRRAFMAALGWPILLTSLLGAAGFRKRLLASRFLALITVTALLTGLTVVIIGCAASISTTATTTQTPSPISTLSPAATPVLSPAAGTFSSAQTVMISDSTSGASIYYTTNGTTPTTASTLYTTPIPVNSSQTIQAMAAASGYSNSAIASAAYTINLPVTLPIAATPTFSPAAGTFTNSQTVTISDATPGAAIYYTSDGTTPTTASALYNGPITISRTATLQAIAIASGYSQSAVASAAYTINTPAASTPVILPASGTYTAPQTVTITDATSGTTIYYTINGSTPGTSSTLYTGPITVSSSQTISAIAIATGAPASSVATATYTIGPSVTAAPVFSPPAGAYTSVQTVQITDATPNASIYYTTDGSTPTTASARYVSPISVSTTQTISAVASANGQASSAPAAALYQLPPRVETPVISPSGSPSGHPFTSPQTITITDTTPGATITDNLQQGAYIGPITLGSTTTVNASAHKDGYLDAAPAVASFFFSIPNNGAPLLSPAAESFNGSISVSLTDTFAGATDYYTTDGSTPTTSSQRYSGPITVSSTETVSAISVTGTFLSPVSSATYTLSSTTPSPTLSANGPNLSSVPLTFTLTDTNPAAVIYYTVAPEDTVAAPPPAKYTGPITVYQSGSITAYAVAPDYPQSPTVFDHYIITGQPSTPTLTPSGGTFVGQQTVTISDATPGVTIYYTTDGSGPTQSSAVYSAPITVSSTEAISAIAVDSILRTSNVAAATYTITAPPVITVQTNANGNITSIPPANGYVNATFSYNNANRLQSVTGSPTASSFIYDYAGKRITKTDGGTPPTIYSYGQGGTLIAENDNGTVTDYIYADGRPVAQIQPGATPAANQISYVLADRLGTPQRLVNGSGATVWSTTYQPFGSTGTVSATVNQNLRLPGQYADGETGFNYNLNRDYMPNVGRYLQADPIGLRGGINVYPYAFQGPTRYFDRKGLQEADPTEDEPYEDTPGQSMNFPPLSETSPPDVPPETIDTIINPPTAPTNQPNSCPATPTVTVGRYMSYQELAAMRASGQVQESLNNGVTSVTYPPSPTAYGAAPPGDVYTEFDVPASSIGASDGTVAKIYGPNSIFGPTLRITEMPPATNIRTPLN